MSRIRIGFIITILALPARAADFQGAAAILEQASATSAATPTNSPANERDKLLADLKSSRASSTNIAPKDAADHWLTLVDRYFALVSKPADPPIAKP